MYNGPIYRIKKLKKTNRGLYNENKMIQWWWYSINKTLGVGESSQTGL